ncbi:MAG: zinc-binding dehydrogenase, partial [Chloroflexi bacterium]
MHAVVFESNGGPEVLDHKEVPDPAPRDGQVLVDVEAVGINFRDVYEREGLDYGQKPPAIVGVEGAGTVTQTGQRVAWIDVPHSYAERVAADPARLVPIPDGISSEIAAAVLLQGITAHYLAFDSYPIQESDWVVVHAAAGGVGLLLTQMAKLRGAHVIGTTSTEEKAVLAREAGADEVLRYEGFADRARQMAGDGGVAAVYDGVGKTTFY